MCFRSVNGSGSLIFVPLLLRVVGSSSSSSSSPSSGSSAWPPPPPPPPGPLPEGFDGPFPLSGVGLSNNALQEGFRRNSSDGLANSVLDL